MSNVKLDTSPDRQQHTFTGSGAHLCQVERPDGTLSPKYHAADVDRAMQATYLAGIADPDKFVKAAKDCGKAFDRLAASIEEQKREEALTSKEVREALEFALLNLTEIAGPLADKHGVVTSIPSASKRIRAALSLLKGGK